MELIQSSFQASFNARIERLVEQEANELRTIFRYFDTDGDGAVSADQATRIFGLLGLEVNPAYVRDLEEVYLAEFMKIVDTHVPQPMPDPALEDLAAVAGTAKLVVPPSSTASLMGTEAVGTAAVETEADVAAAAAIEEEAHQKRNLLVWEDEWRVLDSYRRGAVSYDELRFFLKSCFSPFLPHDLVRFLELYADPSLPEDSMVLTKDEFLKFRREYTARDVAHSDRGLSSDEEDGEGEDGDNPINELTARGGTQDAHTENHPTEGGEDATKPRIAHRRNSSISHVHNEAEVDTIVIDPVLLDDEFVDEDDHEALASTDHDVEHDQAEHDDAFEALPHDLEPEGAVDHEQEHS